ncbi:MAG: hypothetical protein IPL06_09795 [Betaproteobacteria bacterium]|nr:hypothetical protein [Betaproteobacteria bacterium]
MTTMDLRHLPGMARMPRSIAIAVAGSILLHVLLLLIPMREKLGEGPAGTAGPLTVELVLAPRAESPPPAAVPEVAKGAPEPRPRRETIATAPRTTPAPFRVPEPTPPEPENPVAKEPVFDMAAFIAANRARRAQMEAAAARGPPAATGQAPSGLAQNLQTLTNDDGTGGVFQILRIGQRTAEFAFNGWRTETNRKWREVIEVDAGVGGDIERAIVRRMIVLIRQHYSGDFRWESRKQAKVVILSAAPQHNDELEAYLMREFFGTPMVRRGR